MNQDSNQLKELIDSIADQQYQKIQKLRGCFQFSHYLFQFIRIQGSPGANPASIAAVKINSDIAQFPSSCFNSYSSKLALADFLIRRFNQGIKQFAQQNRGKEGSGSFHTLVLSQKMLERDCIIFNNNTIECRFIFSLPASLSGRGVFDGEQTWIMFEQELSQIVAYTFQYPKYEDVAKGLLSRFLEIQQTRQQILQFMQQHDLLVFMNNGAILPRQSGVNDKPAIGGSVESFQSPDILQVDIPLIGNSSISGMAIKTGITCITGGGYHGKSTLLQAILAGVYAHIPDDGREYIVCRDDAVFIRAEEGRSIRNVNINSFIKKLPNEQSTEQFCSDNASGSTSQAANIVEAVESGSRLLLFDEDTCATNFLFRDELIQQILDAENEPIQPLYTALRSMYQQQNISMIFVIGGIGAFLQKADTCLLMDNYQCKDITPRVRQNLGEIIEDSNNFSDSTKERYLAKDNFNPEYINQRLKKTMSKRIKDLRNAPRQLEYGMDLINLEALPQLVEAPQVLSIGYCLFMLRKTINEQDEDRTINAWVQWLTEEIEQQGLAVLQADYPGTLSLPRKYEIIAAINRMRSLIIIESKV